MKPLSTEQKQLIFDYCAGTVTDEQKKQAEQLKKADSGAAELYLRVKKFFALLDNAEQPECPDALAQNTLAKLKTTALQVAETQAPAADIHTEHRPAEPDENTAQISIKPAFWHNIREVAVIAAVLAISVAILIPVTRLARQNYWRDCCQSQLASVFQGLSNYSSEHDNKMPTVATTAGQPWWKVGYQGRENHSNTRNLWLLVKNGYVQPANFICPGAPAPGKPKLLSVAKAMKYNDFPSKRHINYSFRIADPREKTLRLASQDVLMADSNPIAERIPTNNYRQFRLRLDDKLLKQNSLNHRRKGQNVMFCNGSVKFIKGRRIGRMQDDIFTLQNMHSGYELHGYEIPSIMTDAFLAP